MADQWHYTVNGERKGPVPEKQLEAASDGEPGGQYVLCRCYELGHGVPQDDAEAVQWCRRSADQGLACAQFNVGFYYEFGKGVPQDVAEAVKWYRQAAEHGDAHDYDLETSPVSGIRLEGIRIRKGGKHEILHELDKLGVNERTMFPEIEKTAQYMVDRL